MNIDLHSTHSDALFSFMSLENNYCYVAQIFLSTLYFISTKNTDVVIITTIKLWSMNLELTFCVYSWPTRGVSETYVGEDLHL